VKKVLIISNNSGGGHRQTARILAQTLSASGWEPKIISIYQDVFADYFQLFGVEGEKFYNKLVLTKEMTRLIYRLFFICAYYLIILPNRQKFATRLTNIWQ
jgi:UDP-N-acetylglucosamine:LPS N-acetylglucosamine transferase